MTQSQKRGYTVLAAMLAVAAAALLFLRPGRTDAPADNVAPGSADSFASAAARYGDSLAAAAESDIGVARRHRPTTRSHPQGPQARLAATGGTSAPVPSEAPPVFDVNTADTLDLQQLRGIGPVFARRIVKYRTLLGGYVAKEQLREVYGMTDELYNRIAPHLTLDTAAPPVRIDINTATADQLRRHPYLDYYQAKAIVTYRQKCGRFQTMQDLTKVSLIDETTYNRIKPYIAL